MFNESLPTPESDNLSEIKKEYLELTKKQAESLNWGPSDIQRLQETKKILNIDRPSALSPDEKTALHRQGLAGTYDTNGIFHPPLLQNESAAIHDINAKILDSKK